MWNFSINEFVLNAIVENFRQNSIIHLIWKLFETFPVTTWRWQHWSIQFFSFSVIIVCINECVWKSKDKSQRGFNYIFVLKSDESTQTKLSWMLYVKTLSFKNFEKRNCNVAILVRLTIQVWDCQKDNKIVLELKFGGII